MDWLLVVVGQDLSRSLDWWLPVTLFWLLLLLLAVAEAMRPLRQPKVQPGRLVTNFGLGISNALILSALPVSTVIAAQWGEAAGFGLLNLSAVPVAARAALTVIIWSLAIFALHVLSHRVHLLWRLHRVHHNDTAVDLSTGVRHHPLELLWNTSILCALAVLLGLSSGAIATFAVASALFGFWTHLNIGLPGSIDRGLRCALVTPAVHHIHHSSTRAETDSNYGDVFMVWDRLFGSYRPPRGVVERLGLGETEDKAADNLARQLARPFSREP
jgi:sterol desaturase/sphingolipid hydroxylase (fatty acid hydroxylase superfamily)